MPDGSSRNNHRQDQSVLSGLMFLHEKKYNMTFEKSSFNISCWNKCDKNSVETNYNKYALLQRNSNIQLALIYANNINEAIKIYYERKQIPLQLFMQHFVVVQR
jgi:hypothetical protein